MHNFKITAEPFARGFLGKESDDLYKKTGAGLLMMAREGEAYVDSETGLPWGGCGNMCSCTKFGSGISTDIGGLRRLAEEHPEDADDYNYIADNMAKYNAGDAIWRLFTEEESNIWHDTAAWGGTWLGHAVPNLIDIARLGTDGMREKVEAMREKNPDKDDFYDGMILALDALDVLGARLGNLAADAAQKSEGDTARKLYRLAHTFEHCPKNPARDFCDACAVYVMVFTFDGIDSPGHFDWYMIDFWRNTEHGAAREMLEDIWQFFHNTRTWNLCIGGSDENFNDITNELTYEILDVAAKYKYQTPNLTMRCHRNTPEKLLRAAARTIATGVGMPTLYNDEAVCPALERLGIPPRDSHLYVMNGCNQIDIQGKSHMGLEDGEVNLGMAVELAMTGGIGAVKGHRIGVDTGDAADFATFDEFFDAVKAQVHHLCDAACSMSNKSQEVLSKIFASPIRAMTIEGCLERGRGYKDGGPLYGDGQILAEGVADAADSIAAVKKFVFDERRFTMAELKAALAANFEGFDEIYDTLKRSDLRFGNDIDYVDDIAAELIDDYNNYLLKIPTFRGGHFGGGCSPFTRAAQNGGAVGALPNGKKLGENLYGDSIGATPGRDTHGPTALLKSCLKFDHTLPTSGFILNLKFDRSLFCTERGENGFIALQRAYFGSGGQQLSVTVVSREDLIDAKKNPDAHRDLIVRVGGYSDYFVNLPAELQDNVIARTNYEL